MVALGFLLATVGISLVGDGNLYQARPGGFVSDLVEVTLVALPGVLLLPVYRRVGFRKRDCVFFLLLPVWGYVIAWKAGFRLTSLPYRDWPPRPDEYPRCRRIHGSPHHVVLPEPQHQGYGAGGSPFSASAEQPRGRLSG